VFNGSNKLIRRYLHGPTIDQILADENTVPKQITWPLSDHQGTVRDLVNNSGVVQNHIRYDSFGRIVSQTAPALNPRFSYTGREWDSEIELYFYRARYYNPMVGRFIGEDPIEFTGGDGNLYRYVRNSPINLIDPMGTQVIAPPRPIPAPVLPPITPPPPGPWYAPLLRIAPPIIIPLVIPGGLLNPRPTNPYEFPHQLPKKQNSCPTPKTSELEVPWSERRKWPKDCQLETQFSPRPDVDYDNCLYRCRTWGSQSPIITTIKKGGKCEQWHDWVPVPHP
jgi:RHS repeat-associated protein